MSAQTSGDERAVVTKMFLQNMQQSFHFLGVSGNAVGNGVLARLVVVAKLFHLIAETSGTPKQPAGCDGTLSSVRRKQSTRLLRQVQENGPDSYTMQPSSVFTIVGILPFGLSWRYSSVTCALSRISMVTCSYWNFPLDNDRSSSKQAATLIPFGVEAEYNSIQRPDKSIILSLLFILILCWWWIILKVSTCLLTSFRKKTFRYFVLPTELFWTCAPTLYFKFPTMRWLLYCHIRLCCEHLDIIQNLSHETLHPYNTQNWTKDTEVQAPVQHAKDIEM